MRRHSSLLTLSCLLLSLGHLVVSQSTHWLSVWDVLFVRFVFLGMRGKLLNLIWRCFDVWHFGCDWRECSSSLNHSFPYCVINHTAIIHIFFTAYYKPFLESCFYSSLLEWEVVRPPTRWLVCKSKGCLMGRSHFPSQSPPSEIKEAQHHSADTDILVPSI